MKINEILNRNIVEDAASDIASMNKAIADLQKQAAANPAMKASSEAAIKQLQTQIAALQKQPAPAPAAGAMTKWPTTDAEIRAFQQANNLKVDGMIGGKTMAALNKAGAKAPPGFKPVPVKAKQPKTAKQQTDPTKDPYDPNKDPNVQMTPQSEIQAAQSDADKKAAISANLPPVAAATPTATATDTRGAAAMASKSGQTPANSGSSYTGNIGTATNDAPASQSAQPDATTNINPDTGLDATPKPVTTGTGGTTNITTASQDEYAWRAKNPNWNMTGAQYPGPGNWDPRTGRSKAAQAQADANAAAVKGFFNKINPFASKPQDAGATGNVNNQNSGYTQPQRESAELDIIRKLSGLK